MLLTNLIFLNRIRDQLCDHCLSVVIVYFWFFQWICNVNHSKLLAKLFVYGIRDPHLSWVHSFWNGLNQCVRIGKTTSDAKPLTGGVILGGVLCIFLFTIYVYDIFDTLAHSKAFMLAHDLSIVGFIKWNLVSDIEVKIYSDTSRISNVAQICLHELSLSKCFRIRIGLNLSLNSCTCVH